MGKGVRLIRGGRDIPDGHAALSKNTWLDERSPEGRFFGRLSLGDLVVGFVHLIVGEGAWVRFPVNQVLFVKSDNLYPPAQRESDPVIRTEQRLEFRLIELDRKTNRVVFRAIERVRPVERRSRAARRRRRGKADDRRSPGSPGA